MKRSKLIGVTFGRLLVLEFSHVKYGNSYWACKCTCGATTKVSSCNLKSGQVKSCGCLRIDSGHSRGTHYRTNTKEYRIWAGMIDRCTNDNSPVYRYYKGRGIKVCTYWKKFINFYNDMEVCPIGKSLDRINNNKGYCKKNCRWSTQKEQTRNQTKTIFIKFNGKIKCLSEWAERYNLPNSGIIWHRLKRNWSIERAVTTPLMRFR